MSRPTREQILGQPAALRTLLSRRNEIADVVAPLVSETRRIWAVGHGDSYFAPLAAGAAFERFVPHSYTPMMAAELAAYPPAGLDGHALVVACSMSGGVGKTVVAAAAARNRGARVLGITNTRGSRLSEAAHVTINLDIPEPASFLAGTVTYTASVAALLMIALVLGEQADHDCTEIAQAIDATRQAAETETVACDWAYARRDAPLWYILGMGPHVASARYGAAKLAELADAVGIAHEMEEFFHEHHWVIRPDHPVVLLTHDEASEDRSASAAAHLCELDIPVCVVGSGPDIPGVLRLHVPRVAEWSAGLPGAVPLQWLAYWLARAKGLDPDRRTHLRGSPRFAVSRRYR